MDNTVFVYTGGPIIFDSGITKAYWGYYCSDCKTGTTEWFNGRKPLHQYADLMLLVKSLGVKTNRLQIVPEGYDIGIASRASDFLDEHKGHSIVLKNEYGETEELKTPSFLRHGSND